MYAQVLIDQPHEAVDRLFTYQIPASMRGIQRGTRVQVPFGQGNRLVQGYIFSILETIDQEYRLKDIIRKLDPEPLLRDSDFALIEWIRDRYDCLTIEAVRCILPPPLRRMSPLDRMWAHWAMGPGWEETVREEKRVSPAMLRALDWLQEHRDAPVTQWLQEAEISRSTVTSLKNRGWVTLDSRTVYRDPWDDRDRVEPIPDTLTGEQEEALRSVIKGIDSGGGVYCLNGVTGSGKTEIYIRAIDYALRIGKSALMLVPELSLTPQIIRRFRQRFPGRTAILHSRLSEGERYDEWQRVRTGGAPVVIGARSAVFAPLSELGIVILDESHEDSYRSDIRPRYDAREVAIHRGETEGAAVLMGSATPRVGDWHRAMAGIYIPLVLQKRIGEQPMPQVELVDMRRELSMGNRTMFSQTLHDRLVSALERKKQAILLYNRRGYARSVSCRVCGEPVRCGHCDVSMVYHKDGEILKCHYCDATQPVTEICPNCGSDAIKPFGVGIQKVEKALHELLPQARVLRMDSDTTGSKHAYRDMLRSFGAGDYDILLGTQMVAKGLDFPNIEVVGVLAADSTLHLPDYLSAERTFQMITQAAGRAGRRGKGYVIVQTYQPDHAAVRYGIAQDYDGFYRHEWEMRRLFRYPPHVGLMKIVISGEEEDRVRRACIDTAERLRDKIADDAGLADTLVECGAYAAPLTRIRDKYRYQALCKFKLDPGIEEAYHQAARECIADLDDTLYRYIEFDPVSLM